MTTDVRPGTLPAWVVRCAKYGEEWLVLGDEHIPPFHTCGIRQPVRRYSIGTAVEFSPCGMRGCEVPMAESNNVPESVWCGNDRAEADAAFERIEAEWLGRDA